MNRRHARRTLAVLSVLALGGCATFSEDGGFGSVQAEVKARTGKDPVWVKTQAQRDSVDRRVAELLAGPLDVEAAVEIALLNNRGLQAAYAELGIAEAEFVLAGRLPNPRLSYMNASHPAVGGREYKIEQALTINLFSLVTMPLASELQARNVQRVQRGVALEVLRLASETRKAWYAAIAAEESLRYQRQVSEIAEAAAELARRMARVGNFNRLAQAREQSFYADAALGVARAEQARIAMRERLVRLLGLWGEQAQLKLPERLPELPRTAQDLPEIEQRAMRERLDLQAARFETEALAKNLGLTRTTRFINALEFGPVRVLEGRKSEQWKKGYELSVELPLFDWGGARVARAESIYMQAVERVAETAVNALGSARGYAAYRTGWEVARHYRDELVPIRKRIADENLLRYNGMLIGVFELLADARAQVAAVNGAIEALRDFWLAEADLQMALIGKPAPGALPRTATAPAASGGGH
ncbi:MAG: TolC family protein [Betaproteobacteria bacterium]|nr:TolC family protein [Betaproteobacteria bacterium]